MADNWLPIAALLLGAGVLAYLMVMARRKTIAGDMDAPMDLERGRARSEAEMVAAAVDAVLAEEDLAEVEEYEALFAEIRTDEQPVVHVVRKRHGYRRPVRWQRQAKRRQQLRGYAADPLGAPIPHPDQVAEPVLFATSVEQWFGSTRPFLPPVEPPTPDPLALASFTDTWTAAEVAQMVAEYKAGARR